MATCVRCGESNPPAARFCSACGEPQQNGAAAGGREARKTVTVIFCDVVGSTALGEHHDPEVVRAMMARFYAAARAPVERHGGRVEKVIGDALVAVFGVPQVHEDDALRAVAAAVEMRDAVTAAGEVQVRIGVNTGDVLARAGTAAESLVVGDAVNVAARLEQAAGAGQVLVGEATWALVAHAVTGAELPPVEAKGKSAPVRAWLLESVDPTASGQRRRLDLPMVGRAAELELLRGLLRRAESVRRPHLATVIGQPGIGKSRLLAELTREAGGVTVLTCQCRESGGEWSLGPVVEAVSVLTPDQVVALFADAVEGESVAASLRPGARAGVADVSWAVVRLVTALAAVKPVVLALEDIHWAGDPLLDLVHQLMGRSHELPLFVACTARPEILSTRPGWGSEANAVSVTLERLDDTQTEALLEASWPALDAEQAREVIGAAEGNPLFAEHLAALVEDGSGATGLPRSIQLLLTARLEVLPDLARDVATVAAVAGREFDTAAVQALTGHQPEAQLEFLAERQLTEVVADGRWRYTHALLQEAAYSLLPKTRRAELHAVLARWYASEGAGDAVIAEHLERAVALRRELGDSGAGMDELALEAGTRLTAAGRRSDALGDPRRATDQLERALAVLPADSAQTAAAMVELAAASWELRPRAETRRLLDEGGRLAAEHGLRALELRALVIRQGAGAGEAVQHPPAERLRVAREAQLELEHLGDPRALASALCTIADTEYELGRAAVALEHAVRAVQLLQAAEEDLVWAISLVAAGASDAPVPVAQGEELLRGLLARAGVRPSVRIEVLCALAELALLDGREDEGRERFSAAAQIESDIGRRTLRRQHRRAIAEARYTRATPELYARLRVLAVEWERYGAAEAAATVLAELALLEVERGDSAAALEAALQAAAYPGEDYDATTRALTALAGARLAGGDVALANEAALSAVARATGGDWAYLIGDAQLMLARALAAAGDRVAAREAAIAAASAFATKGSAMLGERAAAVVQAYS